jgi:hypothetical protein
MRAAERARSEEQAQNDRLVAELAAEEVKGPSNAFTFSLSLYYYIATWACCFAASN